MGILDEAIRDHLELKRQGGTREADLRRLEDEAFGPAGRPGEPAPRAEGSDHAPAPPEQQGAPYEPSAEPAEAEVPEGLGEPDDRAEPEGEVLFHDFAAEEGLVTSGDAVPAPPVEDETPTPPPTDEIGFDDTQPHDVQTEIGAPEEQSAPREAEEVEAEEVEAEAVEIDEDLELTLDEEDEEIVEGEIDQGEAGEASVEEASDDQGEDVLEETPDFLRETPEHDRLWFEQKPPKDFDFDDDDD